MHWYKLHRVQAQFSNTLGSRDFLDIHFTGSSEIKASERSPTVLERSASAAGGLRYCPAKSSHGSQLWEPICRHQPGRSSRPPAAGGQIRPSRSAAVGPMSGPGTGMHSLPHSVDPHPQPLRTPRAALTSYSSRCAGRHGR